MSKENNCMHNKQLETHSLFCTQQLIFPTMNIWIEERVFNGSLVKITNIIYRLGYRPLDVPMYVVAHFENNNWPP